jgi:8-oxo-dGTP pyrophosphatase MutT (NUDIX family)
MYVVDSLASWIDATTSTSHTVEHKPRRCLVRALRNRRRHSMNNASASFVPMMNVDVCTIWHAARNTSLTALSPSLASPSPLAASPSCLPLSSSPDLPAASGGGKRTERTVAAAAVATSTSSAPVVVTEHFHSIPLGHSPLCAALCDSEDDDDGDGDDAAATANNAAAANNNAAADDELAVAVVVLLRNADGDVLLTRRHPQLRTFARAWVLPGGHVDAGEAWATAAAREVFEETGLVVNADALKLLCAWESLHGKGGAHHFVVYYTADYAGGNNADADGDDADADADGDDAGAAAAAPSSSTSSLSSSPSSSSSSSSSSSTQTSSSSSSSPTLIFSVDEVDRAVWASPALLRRLLRSYDAAEGRDDDDDDGADGNGDDGDGDDGDGDDDGEAVDDSIMTIAGFGVVDDGAGEKARKAPGRCDHTRVYQSLLAYAIKNSLF